jgi:nucleotide-binding universal stress UspA family protein
MNSIIKRILVPIDFSTYSDAAISYAADFAGRHGATIELIHVVEDPFLTGAWAPEGLAASSAGLLDEVAASARIRLSATAAALAARGIVADVTVVSGPPPEGIAERARAGRFDLIVMSTHGRTGLSPELIGSVAARVLRKAPCAVLTVRTDDVSRKRAAETSATAGA